MLHNISHLKEYWHSPSRKFLPEKQEPNPGKTRTWKKT